MTDDIRKLLGGYAAGTLTEEERALLYEAALEDPALFEAMADEQALRDLLDNSAARAELLAAVQDRPFSIAAALRDWFEKPASKVLLALAAVLLVSIGVKQSMETRQPETRDVVAVLRPAPPRNDVQAPAPLKQPEEKKQPGRKETRVFLAPPPAAAPAIASEPPAAPAVVAEVQPAAAVTPPVLTWSVLRIESTGTATPVDQTYAFEEGEKARIRVEAAQAGMLLAKQGEEVLYAGTISPGLPVVLRRDIAFAPGSGDAPAIDLEWAPEPRMPALPSPAAAAPPPPPPPSVASARRETRTVLPQSGVAGGVAGGVVSGQTMGFRASPVLDAVQPPTQNRVRIQLQRKSR